MTEKLNNYWFIFASDNLLLEKNQDTFVVPTFTQLPDWLNQAGIVLHLSQVNEKDCYCCEVSLCDAPAQYVWVPYRAALDLIPALYFNKAARAKQILHWEKNHRYCGRCGEKTQLNSILFECHCQTCQLIVYPKISPAIIVLIKKDKKILLARQAHFPSGVYALIAGFVEAGETIEEAVHREVKEEVGITIKNVAYWGSQPWPFPDSLMLAFIADYESGDVNVGSELECADWYDYDKLPGLPRSNISIAKKLINFVVNELQTGSQCQKK